MNCQIWQPGRHLTLYPGERAENSWDGAAEETVVAAARTVARTANFMVEVVGVRGS